MKGETLPDRPCELCGDLTPVLALYEDHDHGWDALCAACWRLQQPPDAAPEPRWLRPPGRQPGRSPRPRHAP
jgi:hypothetical protein